MAIDLFSHLSTSTAVMAPPVKPKLGVNSASTKEFDFDRIRQDGDTVLLAFSCGKDSLAAWLCCQEAGLKVIPYYQYDIPGIQFVERSLAYYERHFGCHIIRVLHPVTYGWLRTLVHQPPSRASAIFALDLPRFNFDDLQDGVRRTVGIPKAWIAVGTKRNDSLMRRMRIKPDGLNTANRSFHPIAEWRDQDCVNIIARHGLKVPVDYSLFGRSYDGIDYRFLAQVAKYFPEDFATIKRWFPMIEMELFRAKVATTHGQNKQPKRR